MSAVRPFLGRARQFQIDLAISSWQTRKGPRRRRRADSPDLPPLVPLTDPSGTMQADGESREACDRAWIAGLLEGEGSFIANQSARFSYPVIKVEMCEQEVIARAAHLLDTRVWVVPPGTEGWRPTYVAQIAGHRAAEWMRTLRPYMGLRRTAAIDAALFGLPSGPVDRASACLRRRGMRAITPRPRPMQYPLHELVARPRTGSRPEDHAATLIRSRPSCDLYPRTEAVALDRAFRTRASAEKRRDDVPRASERLPSATARCAQTLDDHLRVRFEANTRSFEVGDLGRGARPVRIVSPRRSRRLHVPERSQRHRDW